MLEQNAQVILGFRKDIFKQPLIYKKLIFVSFQRHFPCKSYLRLRGYEVYHTTGPRNTRGGNAVTDKKHIYYHEELKYQTEDIQGMAIEIKTTNET